MGYTTTFTGHVTVSPPLNGPEMAYLRRFAGTRRMDRANGPYHCGGGMHGQDRERDIADYNNPPEGQPGLWCRWVPSDDGLTITWDGGEKFYYADQWMAYLIDTFLKPGADAQQQMETGYFAAAGWVTPAEFQHFTFNHVVNGTITAQGEDDDDRWELVVTDNAVMVRKLPSIREQVENDPELKAAVDKLRAAGVTVGQYADLTGQDY